MKLEPYVLPLSEKTISQERLYKLLESYLGITYSQSLFSFLFDHIDRVRSVIYSIYFTLEVVTDIWDDDKKLAMDLVTHGFKFKNVSPPEFIYDKEYELVRIKDKKQGMSYLIKRYNLTYDQADRLRQKILNNQINLIMTTKLPDDSDSGALTQKPFKYRWYEMLESASDIQENHNNILSDIYTSEHDSEIDIDCEDPILVFTGDWHLGGREVDYKRLLKHWEFLYEKEGIYVFTVGDLIDMFVEFKNKHVIFSQILSPEEQVHILYTYMKDMFKSNKLKVVAVSEQMVHDAGVKAVAGIDIYNLLFREYMDSVKFFHNRGVVTLNLPVGRKIEIAVQHKGSSSKIDPFRANYNMYRDYHQSADIYVSAHYHVGGYAVSRYGMKRRVFINVGAFKKNDTFTLSYFNNNDNVSAYGVYIKRMKDSKDSSFIGLVSDDLEALYEYREAVRNSGS